MYVLNLKLQLAILFLKYITILHTGLLLVEEPILQEENTPIKMLIPVNIN